jgi:hypothetical protein
VLNSKWLQWAKTDEERQKVTSIVLGGHDVLQLLAKVVEKMIEEHDTNKLADYDSPSWAYRQADRNGVVRTLKTILTLTNVKEK